MIQNQTRLRVADNTGARVIQCIRIVGRSTKTTGEVGDVIVASVKQAIPNAAVKKGDVVLFGKYAGSDVQIEGEDYKILRENEILARVEG